jgi:hypothetical protein
MHTTLHWHRDPSTGDINFSGVISAANMVALAFSPMRLQQLSTPAETAADFMACAERVFRLMQNAQRKDLPHASN